MRQFLRAASLLAATCTFATQLDAQAGVRGSRFITTTEWMSDVVARLRARGLLASLSPIAQPYERNEVAQALEAIPAAVADTVPAHVAHWIKLLRDELSPEILRLRGVDSVSMGMTAWAGATAATSPRVDPYFPLRNGVAPTDGSPRNPNHAWPLAGAAGFAERGPFAIDLRIGYDIELRRADPDGRFPAGRIFDALPDNEHAVLTARFPSGRAFVGRLRRNWAPVGAKGLMLSDASIGIPQLGFEIGGRNVWLRSMVGELDSLYGYQRFIAAHRVELLRPDFAISIGEMKVYASMGGPRLVNLNPVEVFFLSGEGIDGEQFTNTALNGMFWLRRGGLTLSGETLVDDIWIDKRRPVRGAISMSAAYDAAAAWVEFGADYRRVNSYAYWSIRFDGADRLANYGRGLGDNQSDYDRATIYANLFPPIAGLRLTPTIAFQRKGEWDFRKPVIPDSIWKDNTSFLQGIPERMTRVSVAGRYQRNLHAFAEWDIGANFVSNVDHVAGTRRTELSAMLRAVWLWKLPRRAVDP